MNDTALVWSVANQVNKIVEKRIQQDPYYVDKERERSKQWYIDSKERSAVKSEIYDEITERIMVKK